MEGELLAPFDPDLVVRPGDLPRTMELELQREGAFRHAVGSGQDHADACPEPEPGLQGVARKALDSAGTASRHFSVILYGYDEVSGSAHSAWCRGERGPL